MRSRGGPEAGADIRVAPERVSSHHGIIRRLGRFPRRKALLGREHIGDETDDLGEGGFAG